MAECIPVPSSVKLCEQRNYTQEQSFVPKTSHAITRRKLYTTSYRSNQFSSLSNNGKLILPALRIRYANPRKKCSTRCYSLAALVSADGTIASNWIPLVDQVLLLASICLTYMAGVIPTPGSLSNTKRSTSRDNISPENSSIAGRVVTSGNQVHLQFAWDIVKDKLMDSVFGLENGVNLDNGVAQFERDPTKQPSHLLAIAYGPRTRLLWATFQWLKKEVESISGEPSGISMYNFSMIFTEIIQKFYEPLFMAWLEEELHLVASEPKEALLSLVVGNSKGYDNIIRSIRKLGKEDLYAELVCALRFGSLREGAYYDHTLFTKHGVAILEDLIITVADGIASMYLEFISVDSSMSNVMNNLGLSLCTLSTRALQRLRNEVALNQWLHQNMEAVASMYEDQFDLRTLCIQFIENSNRSGTENMSWWKKFSLRKSGYVSSPLRVAGIEHITVAVKRTKELRALTGWRYYYSLFLELADITMPLIRTIIAKVSDGISFFLVCLIGRSLGLIYTGIRQSLRWK